MSYTIKCEICGTEFLAGAPNAKYCVVCRDERHKFQKKSWQEQNRSKPQLRKCTLCGSPIVGGTANSRFCASCLKERQKAQNKASNEKRKEKRQRQDTCRGCVDACIINNGGNAVCEYLLNHERCRPWPLVNGCCAGRCTTEREFVEWPWDTERARKLLEKGKPVEDVAAELGITRNALNNWIFRGML